VSPRRRSGNRGIKEEGEHRREGQTCASRTVSIAEGRLLERQYAIHNHHRLPSMIQAMERTVGALMDIPWIPRKAMEREESNKLKKGV